MNREDAIITLTSTASLLRDGTRYMKPEHEKQFREAYEMAIKALTAQPEQRWIPVTKKLPEKNVWVLVTFMMANGEVDTDIMRINRWDGGWDTHTFDMAYRETVIAWMPLPEPYGGD